MVLISDGSSDIDAYVRCNLCYLISLRRSIGSPKRPIFRHASATCSALGKPQKSFFLVAKPLGGGGV